MGIDVLKNWHISLHYIICGQPYKHQSETIAKLIQNGHDTSI